MRRSLFMAAILAAPVLASAQSATRFTCDDARTQGWNFYCETPVEEQEEPEPQLTPEVVPASPPQSYTQRMEDHRAQLEEIKHRAILEPTPENVTAYMRSQKETVQMAMMFTEQWQRQIFANPDLDRNATTPISTIGGNLHQDQLNEERDAALQAAATEYALMFVFEHEASCYVCPVQAEVLRNLADQYEVAVLPISRDGATTTSFPESRIDQGQLENMGLSETPSPFLALVEPKSGAVELIGAGLMTQDVILERIRIITSVPEGELYE